MIINLKRLIFNARLNLVFFLTFFLLFLLYNNHGDSMKKYIGSIFLSLVFGIYLGMFVLRQYKDFDVTSVFNYYDTLYFIEIGVYSDMDSMKSSLGDFSSYIYDIDDKGYHAYVGITKSEENALKVKEYFNNMGYDIIVKDNRVSNGVFISIVNQYDLVLKDASDDAIGDICSQVINSYEELVLNEDKGYSKE